MTFLDKLGDFAKNIGDKATDVAKDLTNKTNDAIETTRQGAKINSEKSAAAEELKKIGQHYYEQYAAGEAVADEVLAFCEAAKVHFDAADAAQAEIDRIHREAEEARAAAEAAKAAAEAAKAATAAGEATSPIPDAPVSEVIADVDAVEVPIPDETACGCSSADTSANDTCGCSSADTSANDTCSCSSADTSANDTCGCSSADTSANDTCSCSSAETPSQKVCTTCGAPLAEGANFCSNCGARKE